MFKIQEKGKPETAIWLKDDPITLSNDGVSDITLLLANNDICKVRVLLENERPYLADMTFNQLITINDTAIPAGSKRALKHGDIIKIGESQFEISNPKHVAKQLPNSNGETSDEHFWRLKAIGNWLDGQVFVLKGKTVIGRDASCTITIPGSHLSRRHVEFLAVGSKLLMKDLDSANGSFHNGTRCKEAQLQNGDEIRLDVLNFKVIAPDSLSGIDTRKTAPNAANKVHAAAPKEGDKNWVTKPTSAGNTAHDPHDILLAKHIKTKRITYAVFGTVFALIAISAFILLTHKGG